MIAIDIGGTKTLIMFSSENKMKEFLDETDFDVRNVNFNDKYCTIGTSSIINESNFHGFVSTLKSIDGEVISTFPGIVRVEYGLRCFAPSPKFGKTELRIRRIRTLACHGSCKQE